MSRTLNPVLPPALADAVRAEPDPADGFTILVLSRTEAGWPHAAMISTGEIIAVDDSRLLLALWPKSTASANLSSARQATLLAVVDHTSYSVRLSAQRLPDFATPLGGTMACFAGVVEAACADEAPYAVIDDGVRFRLLDPQTALARWRQTRQALHALALRS